ncbi:hypothetical protein [Sorangium sp. So ce887]|uniref:hypothetical protein n=1 Tax=Sorangium sp. So ce887 TaxID=3133324 RepID=UPI003F5EB8E1
MKSPNETPARVLPSWVDPVWSSTTPEAQAEQLRMLRRAQARGSLLLRLARGADVRAELAKLAAQAEAMEAMEQEANEAWAGAVLVEGEDARRRSRLAWLGTAAFVLAVLCCVALVALRLS